MEVHFAAFQWSSCRIGIYVNFNLCLGYWLINFPSLPPPPTPIHRSHVRVHSCQITNSMFVFSSSLNYERINSLCHSLLKSAPHQLPIETLFHAKLLLQLLQSLLPTLFSPAIPLETLFPLKLSSMPNSSFSSSNLFFSFLSCNSSTPNSDYTNILILHRFDLAT